MMSLAHWISHWLGTNLGHVETWYEGDVLMVGFQCDTCLRMSHVGPAYGSFLNERRMADDAISAARARSDEYAKRHAAMLRRGRFQLRTLFGFKEKQS